MRAFATARLSFFCTLASLSLIILGIGADICANRMATLVFTVSSGIDGGHDTVSVPIVVMSSAASGMAVATSVITLLVVVPLLVLVRLVKTSQWQRFLSLVWAELCWTATLSILWIATATQVTAFSITTGLDYMDDNESGFSYSCVGRCAETRVLKAFAWLNWLISFAYFVALTGCFIISVRRGLGGYSNMDIDAILSPHDTTPAMGLYPHDITPATGLGVVKEA